MINKSPRLNIYEIIFEADTKAGKWFDILLFVVIIASVIVVILESMESLDARFHTLFRVLEWMFTIFFTVEYGLRLWVVNKPMKYAKSFYGVIDLLAILPTYLSLIVAGSQALIVVRALRLLRVFRIFKLGIFMRQGTILLIALRKSRGKILVFLYFIVLLVTIIGSLMYFVEGGANGSFNNIPTGIYWAIVTLTTVGYGDITPTTGLGQFLSALVMILGYSVIAVPTGIVSAEMVSFDKKVNRQCCPHCSKEGHDYDAKHCKFCGGDLGDMGPYSKKVR